ncbi:hypothetical protein [Candidatus Nanohalovita haloferacivicina]|uniref:hypothetical protein n=1 Tax=Candidatus Nanohalovita haloferacivicina TaxID=2978046 RepID=UPI00325FCCEA|nr:hypothetical protein HBNXNv_0780 [Candidatus Nanohalobia archaeon BNXNv]
MEVESLLEEEEIEDQFTVFEVNAYFYVGVSTASKIVNERRDFGKIKTVFLHDRTDMQQLARMVRPTEQELDELTVYTGHDSSQNYIGEETYEEIVEKVDHGDDIEISGEKFEVIAIQRPHASIWSYLLYQRDEDVIFTGKKDPKKLYKYDLKDGDWSDYSLSEAFCQMYEDPVRPVVEDPNPGAHDEELEEDEDGEEAEDSEDSS